MYIKNNILVAVLLLASSCCLHGMGDFGSIADTLKNFGKGFAESLGHCFDEKYNLKMINDSPITINLQVQPSRQFMGATSDAFEGMLSGLGMSEMSPINKTLAPFSSVALLNNNFCFGRVYIDPAGSMPGSIDWSQRGIQGASGLILPMITIAGMSYFWESGCKDHFFCKNFVGSEDAKEQETNYFHTYTLDGAVHAEFMGPGLSGGPFADTPEFEGVFYNKSNTDVGLKFNKNGNVYTVTLEAESFNTLSSDKDVTDSIRSATETRNFVFTYGGAVLATIPISAQGVGQKFEDETTQDSKDAKDAKNKIKISPLTTTFEITTGPRVGIQGYNLGNFDQFGVLADALVGGEKLDNVNTQAQVTRPGQPDVYPIRSINPIPCSFWYKSSAFATDEYVKQAAAQNQKLEEKPIFLDGLEQVWVAYDSGDQLIKPVMQRIVPDQVAKITIIRPTIKKGLARMYVFSIPVSTDADAQAFLREVIAKKDIIETVLDIDDASDIAHAVPITIDEKPKGFYTDSHGVTGCLLLVDNVVPYGSGESAERFYELTPPMFSPANFAQTLLPLMAENVVMVTDAKAPVVTGQVALTVADMINWLRMFKTNSGVLRGKIITMGNVETYRNVLLSLVPDMLTFLKANGRDTLFEPKSTTLSTAGLQSLYLAYFMPRGFVRPPLTRIAGHNSYLFAEPGKKPDGWPAEAKA